MNFPFRVAASRLSLVVCLLSGCGSDMIKVTGTVKYDDGSIPQAEIASVTFQPIEAAEPGKSKGAGGDIGSDGSFELTTLKPGDGAFPGQYKVTVNIMEDYLNPKSLIDAKYSDVNATPFSATVERGGTNHFDLTIEKP